MTFTLDIEITGGSEEYKKSALKRMVESLPYVRSVDDK